MVYFGRFREKEVHIGRDAEELAPFIRLLDLRECPKTGDGAPQLLEPALVGVAKRELLDGVRLEAEHDLNEREEMGHRVEVDFAGFVPHRVEFVEIERLPQQQQDGQDAVDANGSVRDRNVFLFEASTADTLQLAEQRRFPSGTRPQQQVLPNNGCFGIRDFHVMRNLFVRLFEVHSGGVLRYLLSVQLDGDVSVLFQFGDTASHN